MRPSSTDFRLKVVCAYERGESSQRDVARPAPSSDPVLSRLWVFATVAAEKNKRPGPCPRSDGSSLSSCVSPSVPTVKATTWRRLSLCLVQRDQLNEVVLGYPDQVLQTISDILALARELNHSYSIVYALIFAAPLHQFRREEIAVQEQVKAFIAICTEQGFSDLVGFGALMKSWALADRSQKAQWLSQNHQALADLRAQPRAHWVIQRPYVLTLVAEINAAVGKVDEGLTLLAEAFRCSREAGGVLVRGRVISAQGNAYASGQSPRFEAYPGPSRRGQSRRRSGEIF